MARLPAKSCWPDSVLGGVMSKLTKAARDRDCQVRFLGCSCGMGMKPNDFQAAWACGYCHDIADGRLRAPVQLTRDEVRLYLAEGVMRTQDILIREGKVKL